MAVLSAQVINWPKVSQRLQRDHATGTPLRRALRAPFRTAMVVAMRRLGWQWPVSAPLAWGDVFHGYLPEAVTSLIWRMGYYEPMTTHFVIETLRPGDVFVDIGAHFGYFTLLASRLVGPQGKVVAVEAMRSTFAILSQNVKLNGLENVELHNCAAYSKETTLQFKDFGIVHSSLNTAFSARGVLEGKQAPFSEVAVKARPADLLLDRHRGGRIAIIKIDAESSEEFVIDGLAETLLAKRPMLLLEFGGSAVDDAVRLNAITGQLYEVGYKGMRWQNGQLEAIQEGEALPYENYIFIHSSLLAKRTRRVEE